MTTLVKHFYNNSLHFRFAEPFHLNNYITTLKQAIRRFNIYTAENNSEIIKKYIHLLDTLLDARDKKLVAFSDKLLSNKELSELLVRTKQTIELIASQKQSMTKVVTPKKG